MTFESLVDRVARDMTAADPRAGVSDRVMAAIGPRRGRGLSRVVVPLGAAAAIAAVAILAPRGLQRVTPVPARPSSLADAGAAATPTASLAVSGSTIPDDLGLRVPAAPDARPATRARRPDVRLSAAEVEWLSRAVPALAQPAPLDLTPIQPDRLAIPLLTVEPLATEPLVLPPLDRRPGDRR